MVNNNRIYFGMGERFVGYYDLGTNEHGWLGFKHSGLGAPTDWGSTDPDWDFGVPIQLPNGRVLVRADSAGYPDYAGPQTRVMGLNVDENLDPSTGVDTWFGNVWGSGGVVRMHYSDPEFSGGVWADASTIWIQWTEYIDNGDYSSPSLSRFDMAGNQVEMTGNPGPTTGNYVVGYGGGYELHDGVFWRPSDVTSVVERVNIAEDTMTYASLLRDDPDNPGMHRGWDVTFLGRHPTKGLIWSLYDRYSEFYSGQWNHIIVAWDEDGVNWRNFGDFASDVGAIDYPGMPRETWEIESPIGSDTMWYSTGAMNYYGGAAVLRGDLVYYFVARHPDEGDWGYDGSGTPYGSAARLHSLNLVTGERQEVLALPYAFLDGSGNPVGHDDPSWYDEVRDSIYGITGLFEPVAGYGRMLVNVGDDDGRQWKFFAPKPGENDGVGVGFINVGDDDHRDWRKVRDISALQLNTGDDDNRDWVIANQ